MRETILEIDIITVNYYPALFHIGFSLTGSGRESVEFIERIFRSLRSSDPEKMDSIKIKQNFFSILYNEYDKLHNLKKEHTNANEDFDNRSPYHPGTSILDTCLSPSPIQHPSRRYQKIGPAALFYAVGLTCIEIAEVLSLTIEIVINLIKYDSIRLQTFLQIPPTRLRDLKQASHPKDIKKSRKMRQALKHNQTLSQLENWSKDQR